MDLRDYITDIPDYPREGIVFKDITPLFLDPAALRQTVDELSDYAKTREVEYVVSAEARGFMLGGAVAAQIGAGFIPARKPGKLPREVHKDALAGGARVLVHDDLLATGGTARALCDLVEQAGADVAGCAFLVELAFLGGRARLSPHDVRSLIVYEEE